ncbi:putative adenosine monophosphate deaminase [Trypanosoma grayi]|uniref:putative adenosine monophosphate deaminase n=1 Tax=Trypanosoma grayi TaxID=71804 RepID=UPI0004F46D46|nr:putative adenosine monophosphate deaminase [Trypanosoma grayi]KEG10369.1 putative adenosine monophosphate deaminase [Trypanosoma grayi]
MERRHVSLVEDSDAALSPSMRDEEPHPRDSPHTPVVEGSGSGAGGGAAQVAVCDATTTNFRAGSSRLPNTQRERAGSGLVQMVPPASSGATALSSSAHRRRSMRRRGSLVNTTRYTSPKHNVYAVQLEGDTGGIEVQAASQYLLGAVRMREKYKAVDKGQHEGTERLIPPVVLSFESGVIQFSDQRTRIVPWEQFYDDVTALYVALQHPICCGATSHRLQVLEEKYNLYKLCNNEIENSDRYRRNGGVFADCTKVDNGVYLASIMNAQWLLEYIQDTLEHEGEEVVRLASDNNEPQKLQAACEQMDFADPTQLTVDGLGLLPPNEKRLYRYDVLDTELNRAGRNSAELLRLFLTPDTLNKGRYFADAVRPILELNDLRQRSIQATESIIEMCGLTSDDWEKMAHWIHEHGLAEQRHNQWLIALPRRQIRKETTKDTFEHHQQHLENIFLPLFMATLAPEDPKNTQLASFLACVGGFVIVSDEEERESDFQRKLRRPAEVPWSENMCDLYFAYNIWANLCSLNAFRRRKGLNTLQLRAIAGGRSSQLDVLVYSYLLCDSVANAVVLEHQPVLQYLYGIQRIGVTMSPLSNNGLGLRYMQNPFPVFFRRGLNVSLSTDRPLLFHHSKEPIIEEYGTASKLYQLSSIDVCEIALNSVTMSSFPVDTKAAWLGEAFLQEGIKGNVFEISKVPTARLELRQDMWQTELQIIFEAARQHVLGEERGCVNSSTPVSLAATINTALSTTPTTPGVGATPIANVFGGTDGCGVGSVPAVTVVPSSQVPFIVLDPHIDFPRVVFVGPFERDPSHTMVAQLLHRALELRSQYVRQNRAGDAGSGKEILNANEIENAFRRDDAFDEDEWMFKTVEGVLVPHEVHQIPRLPKDMFHYDDFRSHVQELRMILENIHVRNFSTRRLELLEHKFMLHLAVNRSLEAGTTAKKASQNRDFYQATKVDNNVRMETGMTARHLLNFIVSKANNNGDDIVAHQKGKEPQTLRQLLQELQISPNTLTVDDLSVQVDATLGVASAQYTPEGRDELLTLLLKTDNQMKGRYFAELTKLTFENFKHDRFTFTENRLPIYGASDKEWGLLSDWFDTHGMASFHNQWMVQVPRIYSYLRKRGKIQSFAEYLENIFKPLWAVSLHPSKDPRLFHFVNHISGFDCVEDERRPDTPLNMATKAPHEWTSEEEPPFNYYMYHMWANIYSLNEFRRRRNFSTFTFRPSCGETGAVDHLIGGFLLANAINYGVTLADDAPLQYLFYLARIGVTVSPLSNNTKVLGYLDNPFPHFFRRGLMVSLSTDSPLMFHHTQEPLLEEYSIASKVWKLGPNDMCEIARNSVLLSGFDAAFKRERLGDLYFLSSSRSNDASRTHLSDIRVAYRFDTYHTEVALLEHISGLNFPKALLSLMEENAREAEFLEAVKNKKEVPLGGIIDSKPEEADIDKLMQHRTLMQRQLEELTKTLTELQRQNKQLTEKLADERTRDQQAQQLRRRDIEERWEQILEADGNRLEMGAAGEETSSGRFFGSAVTSAVGVAPAAAGTTTTGEEVVLESGVEEASRSMLLQQQQEGYVGRPASIPFGALNAMGATSSSNNAATATNTTAGTSNNSGSIAAATAALVKFSESMWRDSIGSGGRNSFSRPDPKPTPAANSIPMLPPIVAGLSVACERSVASEKHWPATQRPPTPPRRSSREVALHPPTSLWTEQLQAVTQEASAALRHTGLQPSASQNAIEGRRSDASR